MKKLRKKTSGEGFMAGRLPSLQKQQKNENNKMKGYVVTLMDLKESVDCAKRCIKSAKKLGTTVEMFPGVWRDDAMAELKKEKLKIHKEAPQGETLNANVGNFIAQYRIWKKIIEDAGSNGYTPAIVLEHDAVFVDKLPTEKRLAGRGGFFNVGAPSFGGFETRRWHGIYPLFSKATGNVPGAHAYIVRPWMAKVLIAVAEEQGAMHCDGFLNKRRFPGYLKEVYPWPVECHDYFTTIQTLPSCICKHNFKKLGRKKFRII